MTEPSSQREISAAGSGDPEEGLPLATHHTPLELERGDPGGEGRGRGGEQTPRLTRETDHQTFALSSQSPGSMGSALEQRPVSRGAHCCPLEVVATPKEGILWKTARPSAEAARSPG